MKVLLDTCVWGGAIQPLRDAGHDVVWTGDWERDPGDLEILKFAYSEDRVLVTLDKDFGEWAIVHREPQRGIIRLVGIPARQQGQYALSAIQEYGSELAQGAIITMDVGRTRVRPIG